MKEENTDLSLPTGRHLASGISELLPHIEALIFASEKPLTSLEITELMNSAFGFMEDKMDVHQIDAAIETIVEKYSSEFYPFEVVQSGGGWQFLTKKEFHKTVAQAERGKVFETAFSSSFGNPCHYCVQATHHQGRD
jgi:chromosome segregation and condensation protein ScpB